MSPELERLLQTLYEYDTCEPAHRPKWDAVVQRLKTGPHERDVTQGRLDERGVLIGRWD
jgi:hypothetical protein